MHPTMDRERTAVPFQDTTQRSPSTVLEAHATAHTRPVGAMTPDPESLSGFESMASPSYGSTPDGAAVLEIVRAGRESGLDEVGSKELMARLQEDIETIGSCIESESERLGSPLSKTQTYQLACQQWLVRRALIPDYTLDLDAIYDARGRC